MCMNKEWKLEKRPALQKEENYFHENNNYEPSIRTFWFLSVIITGFILNILTHT